MADRNKSDALQHDTFPGTGARADPSEKLAGKKSGIHPVEQMVDEAIDRIARDYRASREVSPEQALAVSTSAIGSTGRLKWKGIDVSDEFRSYAERVAQGENLPPYTGKILAQPHPNFPWEPAARRKATRRALSLRLSLWGSAAAVMGLIAWSVSMKFRGTPSSAARENLPVQAVLPVRPAAELNGGGNPPVVEEAEAEPDSSGPPSTLETSGAETDPLASASAIPSAAGLVVPAGSSPVAPPAQRLSAPVRAGVPSSPRPAQTELAAEKALGEALGALLGRKASDTAAAAPPDKNAAATPGAPPRSEQAPASPAHWPSAKLPSDTASAPAESAKTGPAGKERGKAASGTGSLLVETPSF